MQGIFRKENTDKALKYGIYRHLPTYEKIIRNLVSFSIKKPHRDATQRHQDVALNRFNFCYNTLFCQLVFQNQTEYVLTSFLNSVTDIAMQSAAS